jgi:hypothetical protein
MGGIVAFGALVTFGSFLVWRLTYVPSPPRPASPGGDQTAGAGEWTDYTSTTGRFTVRFPAKETDVQHEDNPPQPIPGVGELKSGMAGVEFPTKNVEYTVVFADHAPQEVAAGADAVLDAARDALAGFGGKATGETKIKLAGTNYPGRAFTADAPQGKAQCRLFLVKNRLYQLTAIGKPEDAKTFFDSFKVTGT